ncbi:hypothetical protein ACFWGE_10695 [Streptomyces bacillaris]|uniref:hypothetical protein n=1 Tax=Streptomyces bacillaris TaxID=68179 RepID=UPI00362E892C
MTVIEEHAARPGLSPYVENVYAVVADVPAELGMPAMDLSVVLTGDLTASIRQRGERDFQPERTGGIVTGKTIGLRRDFSQTVILLNTAPADADDFDPLEFVHLLSHEFCHAFLGRLRAAAGTRPARPVRVQTPAEAAAILAYEAADEYRCDLFSNRVLATTLSVPVDEAADQHRPLHLGDVFEDGYRTAFARVLDSVHPGWPDLIRSYQHHEITLEDMFGRLVKETESMLILVAHADAVEQAAGHRPLLADFTDRPGPHGLLASAWNPLRAVLDRTQLIPPLSDFADVDRALQDCGRHITRMWATLGVSGFLTDDDELYITVA